MGKGSDVPAQSRTVDVLWRCSVDRWEQSLKQLCILLLLTLTLAGCKTVSLVQDVTQRRATQIVAALNTRGIPATLTRSSGSGSNYQVEVKSEYYSQAIEILNQRGLLEETPASFKELTAAQGFLPSSREMEALRMDHAMASEVSSLLEQHPAIEAARIILRMSFLKGAGEPSVSAVIQVRSGTNVTREEIGQLIMQALPGMKPANVSLTVVVPPADAQSTTLLGVANINGRVVHAPLVPFILGWRVPEDDYVGLALTMITCFVLTGVIGGVVGFLYGSFFQSRRAPSSEVHEPTVRSMKIERPKKDLLDF